MVRSWNKTGFGMIFAVLKILFLLLIVYITLFPFLQMVAVSLSDEAYIMQNKIYIFPKGLNFNAYKAVLSDPRISNSFSNSLLYVVVGTAISLSITTTGAFALSRKKMMFRKFFSLMLVFSMIFSGGMIPAYLVVRSLGLLNTIWGVVLPGSVGAWYVLLMRTFFMSIPQELEDSGRVDGLNDLGIFWCIFLPLSKAGIATFTLFYAVNHWNAFYTPFLYLQDPKKFPLQVILRQIVISSEFRMDRGMGDSVILPESLKFATIMISTLPILLVYPFVQKYFVKGVMVGSIKG
jgi:putative aldouronate transport system permease protein